MGLVQSLLKTRIMYSFLQNASSDEMYEGKIQQRMHQIYTFTFYKNHYKVQNKCVFYVTLCTSHSLEHTHLWLY
jgi:hypothetical protein